MGMERLALEDVTCVLILMFFGVAGAIPGIAPNQASEMTGARASGLMFATGIGSQLLVNAAILILALRQAPRLLARLGSLQFAGALAAFAVFSSVWSQDPVLTARRALPFALAAVFGLYLATRYPLRRTLALFEVAFLLLAVGSALLALGFPSLGLDASTGHLGDWQGVFTQKNACGRAMVFATGVVLARTALEGRATLRRIASLIVFVAVLGMSGSRGAWVIELLLFSVAACYTVLAQFDRTSRAWLAGVVIVCAAAMAMLAKIYFPMIATLLGRDPTLTGRTAIWPQVWIAILKRPWLGYGFSAFWRGTKGASFNVVVALKFVLFHAHNGFLEIWLELGAAGLLLFLFSCLRGWQQLRTQLFTHRGSRELAASAWPLYVLVLIAVYDFDENTLLSFNGLFWVLYVHALVTVELSTAAARGNALRTALLVSRCESVSTTEGGRAAAPAAVWGRLVEGAPWL